MDQIILLIIIGAVGAIFNKLSKKQKSADQDTVTTVSTNTMRDKMKRHFESVISEAKPRPQMNKKIQEAKSEREYDTEDHLEDLKKQEEMYLKKLEASKKRASSIKTQGTLGLLTDEEDIVKGIILSEVLGPPRAKRPYRR